MDTAPVSQSMRLSPRDGLWLSGAVLLHALFFLLPLKHITTTHELSSRALSISLLAQRVTAAVTQNVQPAQVPANRAAAASPQPVNSVPDPADQPAASVPDNVPDLPTAAQLMDSAQRIKWSAPAADPGRQLGVNQPREAPENWRPKILMEDNLFNGKVLPGKTEIVDEWIAADGARNVVINTPSGETLCGRVLAWDPMNPLVEHVTQFRPCGGGGERTFKMPDRYLKHLVK